eukprot:gb/GECH01012323.1/.p1 GENE.gb/GECH01012323.1/~~gb/GECH01012323.1/.p1  ORF type:complete len:363 (+),score=71.87 gb/GECH01012323.1/:1-1089(+)
MMEDVPEEILQQWKVGPISDEVIDAHDRAIYCMDIKDDRVVTGSGDHGLKEFNVSQGKEIRELYSKRYGHKEWVTTCCYLDDGRIISGAMDSGICLWNSRGVVCSYLTDHRASISKVKADENNVAVSASYDNTLKVWDLGKKSVIHTMKKSNRRTSGGHSKPVLTFYWKNSLVFSGGRDAMLCVWDINSADCICSLEGHTAPISETSALLSGDDNVLLSSGLDGYVNVWDLRTGSCEASTKAHGGSVNCLRTVHQGNGETTIVTGGSDKLVKTLDPRMNFEVSGVLKGHSDVITAMKMVDSLCLSGNAKGDVIVHDINNMKTRYGVRATQEGGVTAIDAVLPSHLLVAGEDGNLLFFNYTEE